MSAIYAKTAHAIQLHWAADAELILALVVVWIAIGDISLRGAKLSPMDILVSPAVDKVPPGYDPILATHLLTVRAAMGVLNSFICVSACIIYTSWPTMSSGEWQPTNVRRLLFRTIATVVTIMAGVIVTSSRGICLQSARFVCRPNSMMDPLAPERGLSQIPGRTIDQPTELMHFAQGLWIPLPLVSSGSGYRTAQFIAMFFCAVFLFCGKITGHDISRFKWSFGNKETAAGWKASLSRSAVDVGIFLGYVSFILIISLAVGVLFLSFICFTFHFVIRIFLSPKALLGPSPNVSYQELDQILAIVVGWVMATVSIRDSLAPLFEDG